MEEEIKRLKKIIEENNSYKLKNKNIYKNKFYKIINNIKFKINKTINKIINIKNTNIKLKIKNKINNKKETKIITILGSPKSGKSTIAMLLAIYLSRKSKKTIIIDFDINKSNLHLFLNIKNKLIKNKTNNKINTKKDVKEIKINKNLIFFCGVEQFIKKEKNEDNHNFIKQIMNNYKKKADYIIIDLGCNNNKKINKEILKYSNKNLIISEANILGIKAVQKLIKTYIEDYKLPKNSLHIIENKIISNSIDKNITNKILNLKNKTYRVNYDKRYKNLKNKKINKIIINKKLKRELNKIIKQ